MRAVHAEQAARLEAAARRRRRVVWAIVAVGAVVLIAGVVTVVVLNVSDDTESATPSPLAVDLGCSSCHSVDGARSEGPTWAGLWGSEVTLTDGTTVTADDAYIRESILEPQAKVHEGFGNSMPAVEVTDAQVDQLVAYIKSLQ